MHSLGTAPGPALLGLLAILCGLGLISPEPSVARPRTASLVSASVQSMTPHGGTTPPTKQRVQHHGRVFPRHTGIVATTFWVGEVFDPNAPDGSQRISTYDDRWYRNYGGCDGRIVKKVCRTERRYAKHGWFPRRMKPLQNPFYLDVPYDDLNDPIGFRNRGRVIPWAKNPANRRYIKDRRVSLMKDRWVRISRGSRVCYGQIQDAGPGHYHDANYVFGHTDARPASTRYNNAGIDVSPALNGCLGFRDLNGQNDVVSWRFVPAFRVPEGPWRKIVTRTPRPAPRR